MSNVKFKIKKGDKIIVITGKDRGRTGIVQKIITKKSAAIVDGINQVVKNVRASQQFPEGGQFKKNMPIHISNIKIVDPKLDNTSELGVKTSLDIGVKIGYKLLSDKSKVRFSKKTGEVIDTK
jgi:large subunit ribosomal protein L24